MKASTSLGLARVLTRKARDLMGLAAAPVGTARLTSQDYWSGYNVTEHRQFKSAEESLTYFHWRSKQYYDYLKLMPVAGLDGKTVLDYGCGPGHDLVGMAVFSPGANLIAMDVSAPSLEQARDRLALHQSKQGGGEARFIRIDENDTRLPLDSVSIDHIHCSGVLHHVPDPQQVLHEFNRILRPGGSIRLMIYNYDSVWLHLFAAYLYRMKQPDAAGLSLAEAFRRVTDTPQCPISHAWKPTDVEAMARSAGLISRHVGNAVAANEMVILPKRFEAIMAPDLEEEHRDFLLGLTFDERGLPRSGQHVAGLDGCYELTRGAGIGPS